MNSLFNFAHAIYDDRSDNTQRTNQNAQHVNYMLNNHIDDSVGNDARGVALLTIKWYLLAGMDTVFLQIIVL